MCPKFIASYDLKWSSASNQTLHTQREKTNKTLEMSRSKGSMWNLQDQRSVSIIPRSSCPVLLPNRIWMTFLSAHVSAVMWLWKNNTHVGKKNWLNQVSFVTSICSVTGEQAASVCCNSIFFFWKTKTKLVRWKPRGEQRVITTRQISQPGCAFLPRQRNHPNTMNTIHRGPVLVLGLGEKKKDQRLNEQAPRKLDLLKLYKLLSYIIQI